MGLAATAAMVFRIFHGGPIGMADNGDGPYRMCAVDTSVHLDEGSWWWFKWANFRYDQAKPEACTPENTYPGSGKLMPMLARPLSHLLGYPGEIDLRAQALLWCALVGLAFAVFAVALRGRLVLRLLVCAALFLVVGDSVVAGYAATPYSELAGLTGLLFATAGAVHLGGSGRARLLGLLVFTAGSVVLVASKMQALTMAVPLLALLLFCKVPVARLTGRFSARVLPLAAALLIGAAGTHTLMYQMEAFKEINRTEVIFVGIMGKSPDPAKDAVELGLPADFGQYAGLNWWGEKAAQKDPRWPEVRDRITYANIAGYLAEHPGVALRIARGGLDDFAAARPDNLGSYPVSAGKPAGAQEHRLALYTGFLRTLGGGWVLGLQAALALAGAGWLRRSRGNPRRQAFLAMMICLAGATATQFVTAMYGEAIENTKHLIFGIFATGLAFVLAAAAVLAAPAEPAPPAPAREEAGARDRGDLVTAGS
ncbi:glycan biosynthesis hexose transferase WsfD [Kitasatospora sp. NPDC001664]